MSWQFYTANGVETTQVGPVGPQGDQGNFTLAQTVDTKSGSYTLVNGDAGKIIAMNSGSAQTVTINSSLGLSAGQRIDVIQTGGGQVTFSGSSVTLNGTPGLKTRAQYSGATVVCTATNTYVVLGDLE